MRIVQAYTYKYGVHKNITLGGNQGICSECTAVPYENNDLNISTLCSGTRFFVNGMNVIWEWDFHLISLKTLKMEY